MKLVRKELMLFVALTVLAACNQKQPTAASVETEGVDKTTVTTDEQATDYYTALDRYLAEQIAAHYAPGEYSVPLSDVVAVNVGDTLKCVSGGSHPGLMHICQKGEHFYVSQFEQVEDGSGFLPSARRIFGEYFESFQIHHSDADEREKNRAEGLRIFVRDHGLSATMYQDEGWPAKEL